MRSDWKKTAMSLAVLAILVLALGGGCTGTTTQPPTGGTKGPIRIGSKIDIEGPLLAQMMIAMLKQNGFTVQDKTRTGATNVVRSALLSGQIDMYPEYTANAILVFNKGAKVDPGVLKNAQSTYFEAKSLDASNGVVWLQPAPSNNTWAVAVPRKFAVSKKIISMTEWADYIKKGGTVKIVGSSEFFSSTVAMPSFENTYGFKLASNQQIVLSTGDTAVTEKAAAQGTNGANAAMAYGTDGTILALDLVVLSDPKHAQPFFQPAPVVRKQVFDKFPEIASILDPVFTKLTVKTLEKLNGQIAVQGQDPKTVATEWLRSEGFLK